MPELAHLGFDPVDDMMSWVRFGELLTARKAKLKALLMDQKFVAGIGNIYSDEILCAAGLRYDRSSETLSSQEVRRLYRAMVETLQDAIKHRGSSLSGQSSRPCSWTRSSWPASATSTATRSCGAAGLRYDRGSETLSSQEVRRLYRAMVETLQDAIKHRGSSLADEQYRDLFGAIGEYQKEHKVYDRAGQACRRCRSTVVKVKVNGRSSFLCEQCQV